MKDKLKYIRCMRRREKFDANGKLWLPINQMQKDFDIKEDYQEFDYKVYHEIQEIKESCRQIGARLVTSSVEEIKIDKGLARIGDIVKIYDYCSFADDGYYDIKNNRCIWKFSKDIKNKAPFKLPDEIMEQFEIKDIFSGNVSVTVNNEREYINLVKNMIYFSDILHQGDCIKLLANIPNEYPYNVGDVSNRVDYIQIRLNPELHIHNLLTSEYLFKYSDISYSKGLREFVLKAKTQEDFEVLKSLVKVFYPEGNSILEEALIITRKYI